MRAFYRIFWNTKWLSRLSFKLNFSRTCAACYIIFLRRDSKLNYVIRKFFQFLHSWVNHQTRRQVTDSRMPKGQSQSDETSCEFISHFYPEAHSAQQISAIFLLWIESNFPCSIIGPKKKEKFIFGESKFETTIFDRNIFAFAESLHIKTLFAYIKWETRRRRKHRKKTARRKIDFCWVGKILF